MLEYIIIWMYIILFWIHAFILFSDIKYKIIPNKYIILLWIIIYFILFFHWYISNNILYYIVGYFLIGFLLSTFRIWWAGDSKYFMILGIHVYYIGMVSFIWNIVIWTFILILLYILKSFIFQQYGPSLRHLIHKDFQISKSRFFRKYEHSKTDGILLILNPLNYLLLLFLLFKLVKELLFSYWEVFLVGTPNSQYILIIITISIIILFRYFIEFIKRKTQKFTSWKAIKIDTIFNLIIGIMLVPIIYIDYIRNTDSFIQDVYHIITLWFILYVGIKVFIYLYKKCFIEMEQNIIHIDDLYPTDIIDSWFFNRYIKPLNISDIYISDTKKIKNIIKESYPNNPYITTLNTFPFSTILFISFLYTWFFESSPILWVIEYMSQLIFSL